MYHAPGSPWYERTEIDTDAGERWFCTEEEALEAGWRAPNSAETKATSTVVQQPETGSCKVRVNINTAEVDELDMLPGIGPVKAKAIVDYRSTHGAFKDVEELDKVGGIGTATLDKIRGCAFVH